MKAISRLLLCACLWIAISTTSQAATFNYNETEYIQLYYDYCERDIIYKFVYIQTQGDNDVMRYLYLNHNPSQGSPERIVDFRHLSNWPNNETGLDTLSDTGPGDNYAYKFPNSTFDFNVELSHTSSQTITDGFVIHWVYFRIKDVPESMIETFTGAGYWDGDGDPSEEINVTRPVTITVPAAPTGLMASSGECGVVNLTWNYEDFIPCINGKHYDFLIYRDNFTAGAQIDSVYVNNENQTQFSYQDYLSPVGTSPENHNYKVKAVLKNGPILVVQSSAFSNQAIGFVKALPVPPSDLEVSYQGCAGNITLNWTNEQVYDSIEVVLTHGATHDTIRLSGSPFTRSTTILDGPTYSAVIDAYDECETKVSSAPLTGIVVPNSPSDFSLNPITISNGKYQLSWTVATGADRYEINRTGDGAKTIQINDPAQTSYQDADVKVCTQYRYSVTAINDCGSTNTQERSPAIIPKSLNVWSDQTLSASKGYYGNRVDIEWDAPDGFGFDHYKIYRKTLGSTDEPDPLGIANKNELKFIDLYAQAGVLYEYSITAYSECGTSGSEISGPTDIGFRLPIAVVTGNIKFENGTGVEGVEVTVERNAGALGKSLHLDGSGAITVHTGYFSNPASVLPSSASSSVECWIRPDNIAQDFSVFQYVNGNNSYGMYYDASETSLVLYWSDSDPGVGKKYHVPELEAGEFNHLSWNWNGDSLYLFVNGVQPESASSVGYSSPGGTIPLTFGLGFTGYLDEIRYWDLARSGDEVLLDFGTILSGDEPHLQGYWRVDEGVGTGVYDISGVDEEFNAHHLQFNQAHATWTNTFPQSHLLGNVAVTDSVGNYVVNNIRYSGTGNTFTVFPFFKPGGTPHEFDPASKALFLGEGNPIQNSVDFIDISSFRVTGSVRYSLPDSMCSSSKAFIYIDDRIAQVNGQPVYADPLDGTFEIRVPIGLHRLSVSQGGHVFHNEGQWLGGQLYDFQEDETGIEFFDSTRVRVIGRVCGGTIEEAKKLGFHQSKNNIGTARITFTSQIFGCHETVVYTDLASGEYSVDLLPIKYDISVEVPSNPAIDFGIPDALDLGPIQPEQYVIDTTFNPGGQPIAIDSVRFNVKRNFVYRVSPVLEVVQARDSMPLAGDSEYAFIDPITLDTIIIPLNSLPYPAFLAGKTYETLVFAFEQYFNNDDPNNILEDRVPVTDGELVIHNGLGNETGSGIEYEERIDLNSPDGSILYPFIGGQPEFVMDGMGSEETSFTKTFDLELRTPSHIVLWRPDNELFRGYVLGAKPVDGSSFITEGPEVVDLILRDPPGDASFSSFIEGYSYANSQSWYTNFGASLTGEIKIITGSKFLTGGGLAGIGFDTETRTSVISGFSVTGSYSEGGTYSESYSFENGLATNSDPYFTGTDMDLYVGKSTNFLFGKSDELTLINTELCDVAEACFGPVITVGMETYQLAKRRGLFMVPEGFNTTFIYSQFHIEQYLIPNLEDLRNNQFSEHPELYQSHISSDHPGFGLNNDDPFWGAEISSTNPDRTEPEDEDGPSYLFTPPPGNTVRDEIRWYNQQIRLWKEAMARNEKEKLDADLIENISFDAGATFDRTTTHSTEDVITIDFEVGATFDIGLHIEGDVAGSGSEAKFVFGLQLAVGGSDVSTVAETNTYAFHLQDGQPGDFFSIDVKGGKKGNGPVFSLRGGQSMCPWERGEVTKYYQPGTELSISTIRRELPDLDVEPSFQANVPEHQPARYRLKLRNASPTGEIQWYGLRVLEQTNPYGAQLKIDGFSPNGVFEVPAGETIEKTLELYKSPDTSHYEIKLMLYSTCEYEGFQNGAEIFSTDTITIAADFVEACSPVSVRRPVDQWISNVEDSSVVLIQLQDYIISDPGLENIQLQYKPSFTSVWKGIETLWKTVPNGSDDPQIPPGSEFTSYLWEVDELPDGPYDIRAVTHCTNTGNDYPSPHVSGIIDRVRPHAFGNPQPADGVLDPNDELVVQFNEILNPASVNAVDFDIRAFLNGAELRHDASIELDGINDYVQIPVGTRIGGTPFTHELWIKRLSNGAGFLWSQGENADSSMAIGFTSNNELYFRWHMSTVVSDAVVVADDAWHHIAVTCNDEGLVSFFETGDFAGSGVVAAMPSIPGQMTYGKAAWGDLSHYHGYMHEARIWRTELTEGAIRSQMLKKLSGVEAGLSTLWPMDDAMGSVVHEVVRKRNGTLFGSWAILPSGSSFVFDGIDDELGVDAGTMVFSKQHHFTIEFWVKGADAGSMQTIMSNGRGDGTDGNDSGWSINVDADGKLIVAHGGQMFTMISIPVLDDNWHHVALVLNRQGNLNSYLDGNLQNSIFGDVFGDFGGSALWIGNRGWYDGVVEMHDQYFDGALDEVRVWNTKMTAEYIRATMQNRLAGDEFGLQLYLPFESYMEIGGIPILTNTYMDQSPLMREVVASGGPQFQEEDPNIKLLPPLEKVNFTYSINGDRILITTTTDPLRLERTTLFISLRNVEDIYGNELASPITWTAFVNRNQLQWEDDELYFEKPEKEPLEFTASIVNSGGIELSYEILGLPEWLSTTIPVGTIAPVSTRQLTFFIDSDLKIGDYSIDVNLVSGQGYNDKLALNLHVFGVPPEWNFNPNAYQHSMNIVADLSILGELSDDPLDRVVAYVEGEVRGLTTLEYIPELDQYLGFLEVYSNKTSGESISFKAWDASTGVTYAGVELAYGGPPTSKIPFTANALVGNAVTPARWQVTNDIIQEIPLNAGWTWISFNVESDLFEEIDSFFMELKFEDGDTILSQTKVAKYNPASGWGGNLVSIGLEIEKMYKTNFTYEDILRVVGNPVDPQTTPVGVTPGWNWIPFLSRERLDVNEALSSFIATPGDIVKSQDQFAVYHPTQGWVGTLRSMEPGKGYMLFADNAGTLVYPKTAKFAPGVATYEEKAGFAVQWRSGAGHQPVSSQARNMTMLAVLKGDIEFDSPPAVAAFAGNQLLQIIRPIQVTENGEWLYYLTLQGNADTDIVHFEVYDEYGRYAGLVDEMLSWGSDQSIGALEQPFVLHLNTGSSFFTTQPNPFSSELRILIEAAGAGIAKIAIFDVSGVQVYAEKVDINKPGLLTTRWDGRSLNGNPVAPGVYFIRVEGIGETHYEKVVRQ